MYYDDEEREEEREPEEVQTVTVYPPSNCCICGRPECGYACFRCGQAVCYNQENYFGDSPCGGWILDSWHPEHPHGNEFYCTVCLQAGLIPESGLVIAGIPIKADRGKVQITVGGQVQELSEEDAKDLIAYLWTERGELFGKPYDPDAETQESFDQEKALADYKRLMDAGPVAENDQELQALVQRAYAEGLYFDYDKGKQAYVLVPGQKDVPEKSPVPVTGSTLQEDDEGLGELEDHPF